MQSHWHEGKAYLHYKTPSPAEVDEWVYQTSDLVVKEKDQEFQSMREGINLRRGAQKEKAYLLTYARGEPEAVNFPVCSFQLMMFVCHKITDGIGARVLLDRYLKILADWIANPLIWRFQTLAHTHIYTTGL